MITEKVPLEPQPVAVEDIRWQNLYREADLYKAAIRVYTKPLFFWRKALSTSDDGRTLYDFARRGLQNLEAIHKALSRGEFKFRPGLALDHNFNGKKRTLYIFPWEERIVDLLLYRLLSRRFHSFFSSRSFAYRLHGLGVDRCQRQIAKALLAAGRPLFVCKRDISNYFPSIDHAVLRQRLATHIPGGDYLWELLDSRIRFEFRQGAAVATASRGVPFGTPIACFFANLYLTELDRCMEFHPGLHYFRYADDFLFFSSDRDACRRAAGHFDATLASLRLRSKQAHECNFRFSEEAADDSDFLPVDKLRHLGLEFRANGVTALSRDKFRKICNLFRFAFRRNAARLRRTHDPEKKARLAIDISRKTIEAGVRNVAILDYYLKHVEDEQQLRSIDRWLAEEVLSLSFGGHRRGNFRRLPFARLREMGLPSLVHRRRLIHHGKMASPFFIWKRYQEVKGSRGIAVRPRAHQLPPAAFSSGPEAAA